MDFNLLVILGGLSGLWIWQIINHWGFRFFRRRMSESSLFLLEKLSFYSGGFIIILVCLNLLSIHIQDFLATAGIVTIAIGFAAKTSISNFISGVILLSSKKISVDDLIQIDDYVGIVENIDIFSTKIRTFDNVLLNIPNEKLMTDYIQNFSRYSIRRVTHDFLICYQDFNQELLNQLQEELNTLEEILVEPKPLLVFSNQTGQGIHVSVRVWCESTQFIQTQNALVIHCLTFLKANSIRNVGEALMIDHPSFRERN